MAVATKSKLNSKLPGVAKIAFCSAAGKNMSKTLFTGENGKFTRKVGFQQKSKKYPYQIQFRQRSRYVADIAKQKGANWTKWSQWKAVKGFNSPVLGSCGAGITQTDAPVNQWMKANVGVNKKGTYKTFKTFTNYQIGANYDARQFEYRIRTFNKSKARHGSWITQRLKVYKRAAIADEKIVEDVTGGIQIRFNYKYSHDLWIDVNSIKDSDGRELLKASPLRIPITNVTYTATSIPAPRNGYQGGYVKIPLKYLKRKIEAPETLSCVVWAVTGDGALTELNLGTVYETVRTMTLNTSYKWDENTGTLKVTANNVNHTTITSIAAYASYYYNGKPYSVYHVKEKINLNGTSTFYLYPPVGLPVTVFVRAAVGSGIDKGNKTVTAVPEVTFNSAGYRINGEKWTDTDDELEQNYRPCAILWGEPTFQVNSVPQYETALPYGRNKNIIFYGNGDTTTITLQGKIVDKPKLYGGKFGRKIQWDFIKNNPGIYWFRTPKGDMYKVGITGITFTKSEPDIYDVEVNMVEVV